MEIKLEVRELKKHRKKNLTKGNEGLYTIRSILI
jgi:hypothetical protein